MCDFCKGCYEEQFCEIILNLGQEEMSYKSFLIWSSGGPPVRWSGTIYAILKEGIMGNIRANYLKFGLVVQEEMSFKEKVYLRWTK